MAVHLSFSVSVWWLLSCCTISSRASRFVHCTVPGSTPENRSFFLAAVCWHPKSQRVTPQFEPAGLREKGQAKLSTSWVPRADQCTKDGKKMNYWRWTNPNFRLHMWKNLSPELRLSAHPVSCPWEAQTGWWSGNKTRLPGREETCFFLGSGTLWRKTSRICFHQGFVPKADQSMEKPITSSIKQ